MRLTVERAQAYWGWDDCAIASDGRVLVQKWNYQEPDRFSLGGKKSVSLPDFEERRIRACGARFVFLGQGDDGTPARVVVFDAKTRAEYDIPRKGHEHHFLSAWLDGDELAFVVSDEFHIVHGIGITEVTLAKRTKQAPIAKVLQLGRHIGKGHAQLSLQSVLRTGDTLYALASAGDRYYALLELEPKAKSFGSRVIARMKADQAVFSSGGEHVVFYERNKLATIVALDGTKLAAVKPDAPTNSRFDLVAAAPGFLGMRMTGKRETDIAVIHTSPWPAGARGKLDEVPETAAIADLPVEDAHRYSPEPTSYSKSNKPPAAFGAVVGWGLNVDKKKKPTITHAIVTDSIVDFFTTTDRKLRLLFNFDLSGIVRVDMDGDRVMIRTLSGTTILRTTPAFASALRAAVKRRR